MMLLGSCVDMDKVSIGEIESTEVVYSDMNPVAMSVWVDASVWVENLSGRNIQLKSGHFTVYSRETPMAYMAIRDKVTIPRRSDSVVMFPLEAKVINSSAIFMVVMAGTQNLMISGDITLRSGLASKTYRLPKMTVEEFARQFGININDIIKGMT